jgi:hypothetical protein
MKLYKFRAFEQLEFVLDIVLNERLYCAGYAELNDPFEGMFQEILPKPLHFTVGSRAGTPLVQRTVPASIEELHLKLTRTRVCSLSAVISDVRLWSQYGGGHAGVAIEIDCNGLDIDVRAVTYTQRLPERYNTLLGTNDNEGVLLTKSKHWEHEQEFRVLASDCWYPLPNRVKRVILGHRMTQAHQLLLERLLNGRIPVTKATLDFDRICVRA